VRPGWDCFDANSVVGPGPQSALGIGGFTFFQRVEHLLGHDIFLQLGQLRAVFHFHLEAGRDGSRGYNQLRDLVFR
jgi:hypothetical protein